MILVGQLLAGILNALIEISLLKNWQDWKPRGCKVRLR
jgi:hypothetical protein